MLAHPAGSIQPFSLHRNSLLSGVKRGISALHSRSVSQATPLTRLQIISWRRSIPKLPKNQSNSPKTTNFNFEAKQAHARDQNVCTFRSLSDYHRDIFGFFGIVVLRNIGAKNNVPIWLEVVILSCFWYGNGRREAGYRGWHYFWYHLTLVRT